MRDATKDCPPFTWFLCQMALPTGAPWVLSALVPQPWTSKAHPTDSQVAGIQIASLSICPMLAVCPPLFPHNIRSLTPSISNLTLGARSSDGCNGSWCRRAGEVPPHSPGPSPLCSIFFSHLTSLLGAHGCIFSLVFMQTMSPFCPKHLSRLLDQWLSKCGPQTSSVSIPWKLVRHAESWPSRDLPTWK